MSHYSQRFVFGGRVPGEPYPQRSAVTPLAYFSFATLAEHDEVQKQLDAVRVKAAEKALELDALTRTHRRAQVEADELAAREEDALRQELLAIQRVVDTLRLSGDKAEETDRGDAVEYALEVKALGEEMESIARLEEDLRRLRETLTDRCAHTSATKASFVMENERTAAEFNKRREEAARMGVEVNRVRAVSPHRGRPSALSFVTPHPPGLRGASPPRTPPAVSSLTPTETSIRARSPVVSRYVSPTRHGDARKRNGGSLSDSLATPRRENHSPGRITTADAAGTEQPMMHRLCSNGQVDEALSLLRQRPEVVNLLDPDANTPLHCACASPQISLELVNALLVAGSSTSAKNDSGYTPFHVACLNVADHGSHSLKKFLLFKASVPPNQRTSRGETAAHLCARHDRHLESLKYLTTAGVDLTISAMTQQESGDAIGSPRRRTALEAAQLSGVRARRCADVLKVAGEGQ
jgi:hypothetical protein